MLEALKNFVLAIFGVGFLLGVGWIIASERGHSKPDPHPFPHAFLDQLEKGPKPLVVAYQGLTTMAPPNSLAAFKAAVEANPNVVLWVDARPSHDGTWMAWHERSLPENARAWISYSSDAEVAKADAGYSFTPDQGATFPFRGKGFRIETLKAILTAFPDRFFVLNFQDYHEGGKDQIVQLLNETKAGERALITSPEDGILKDLREAQPTWLFGTSRAQITRLVMLSQIALAASAPIRGDVFVWTPDEPIAKLSDRAFDEIRRRKMKTVIAIDGASDPSAWVKRADAVVTVHPNSFSTPR